MPRHSGRAAILLGGAIVTSRDTTNIDMKPYELGGYHFVLIEGEVYVRYSDVFEEEREAEEEEQEEEEKPKPKKRGSSGCYARLLRVKFE